MADKKIINLPAFSTIASGDLFEGVDISDTTDSASGSSKKATALQIQEADISADVTYATVTTIGNILVRETDDGNDAVKLTSYASTGDVSIYNGGSQTVKIIGNSGDSYINTGGNFGIGTTSPGQKLEIGDATDSYVGMSILSTAGSYINFGDVADDNVGIIDYNHASNYMRFYTNAGERVRIDDSGNFLIGTTAGIRPLQVHADTTAIARIQAEGGSPFASRLEFADDADGDIGYIQYEHGSNKMTFRTNNVDNQLTISSAGVVAVENGNFDYLTATGDLDALGNLGATETITWSNASYYTGTLDANTTISFSGAATGQKITLALAYDGSAQRTITWPTTKWAGGSAPDAPSASGEILVVTVLYDGTNYLASGEVYS